MERKAKVQGRTLGRITTIEGKRKSSSFGLNSTRITSNPSSTQVPRSK